MEIRDINSNMSILISGDHLGDIGVKTNKLNNTVEIYTKENGNDKVVFSALKKEFTGITKAFVQFENEVLENNDLYNKYKDNNENLSYVQWLEEYASRYFNLNENINFMRRYKMKTDYSSEGLLGDALQISVREALNLRDVLDECLKECQKNSVEWIIIPHENWKE